MVWGFKSLQGYDEVIGSLCRKCIPHLLADKNGDVQGLDAKDPGLF